MAKAHGEKFNVSKSIATNLVSNAVPGLGEAKTVNKSLMLAKTVDTAMKVAIKGTGKGIKQNHTVTYRPSNSSLDKHLTHGCI